MKYGTKLFVVLSLFAAMLFMSHNSFAKGPSNYVGQCVFPITKQLPTGYLVMVKPVTVLPSPDATTGVLLKTPQTFTVKAESGKYIQLATIPDYSEPDPFKNAGRVVGWVLKSDFKFQALRNCT